MGFGKGELVPSYGISEGGLGGGSAQLGIMF